MATAPDVRRWDALFAQRTRGDVGEGIAGDPRACSGSPT